MFTLEIPIKRQHWRIQRRWWYQWQHSFGIFPSLSIKTQSKQITKPNTQRKVSGRTPTNSQVIRMLSASVEKNHRAAMGYLTDRRTAGQYKTGSGCWEWFSPLQQVTVGARNKKV